MVLAEDELWERLRVPGHVVFRFKDDAVSWLGIAEVLAIDLEGGTVVPPSVQVPLYQKVG